jgi:hypothetical protein
VRLLDDEVAAGHLLLERSIDQRDVASLPAASTALARDGSLRVQYGRSDRFKRRLEIAKDYFPKFGLAAPCGFGRHQSGEVPGLLDDHRRAIEILHDTLRK